MCIQGRVCVRIRIRIEMQSLAMFAQRFSRFLILLLICYHFLLFILLPFERFNFANYRYSVLKKLVYNSESSPNIYNII